MDQSQRDSPGSTDLSPPCYPQRRILLLMGPVWWIHPPPSLHLLLWEFGPVNRCVCYERVLQYACAKFVLTATDCLTALDIKVDASAPVLVPLTSLAMVGKDKGGSCEKWSISSKGIAT